MKRLRSLSLVILTLSLGVGFASAQSLAEVAKKEKERREKNKEEAKRVITDRELTSGYGGLPATRAQAAANSEAASEEAAAAEGEAGSEGEEPQDETKTQEYWQNRVKGTKEKIAKLEQELAAEDTGEGQAQNVDPRGLNFLQRRQKLESDLAAARQELSAIQDEARRAGVPPGWAR